MEVTTIIGIVVAIIICLVGLTMMLRKPNDAAPSLDSELHINADCNQPVIPRHVRDQLQVESETAERVEPSLNTTAVDEETKTEKSEDATIIESKVDPASTIEVMTEQITTDVAKTDETKVEMSGVKSENENAEIVLASNSETEKLLSTENVVLDTQALKAKVEPEFTLNPNVQAAEIKDFEEESSILDVHLHEQQRFDDESELARAEHIISLNVYPNPRKALSGDKTLKVLLKYGLRFGEMNCFHRYESPEQDSHLMFSVLRITEEGPAGFDLEALSVEQVKGLAFFLALPHQNVQKGYDSMVSIAGLIARETDGTVYDENNLEFTPQLKEHWRHKAIDYRSGQDV